MGRKLRDFSWLTTQNHHGPPPACTRTHARLTLFRLALTTALYTHLTAARPREASERLLWRVRRGAWPQAQRAGARQSAGVVASCAGSVGKILVQQAFTTTKLCQRTRGTRGGRPVSGARRAGGLAGWRVPAEPTNHAPAKFARPRRRVQFSAPPPPVRLISYLSFACGPRNPPPNPPRLPAGCKGYGIQRTPPPPVGWWISGSQI